MLPEVPDKQPFYHQNLHRFPRGLPVLTMPAFLKAVQRMLSLETVPGYNTIFEPAHLQILKQQLRVVQCNLDEQPLFYMNALLRLPPLQILFLYRRG